MSTSLRVAIDLRCVAEGDRGGVSRFAVGVTEALAARPNLTVLPFAPATLPMDISVAVHHLGGGGGLTQQQLAIPRLLLSLRADVLLSPANHGLPLVAPCPMVLVIHDTVAWGGTDAPAAPATGGRLSRSVSLSRAARILTMSEHSASAIMRRLDVEQPRIRVVPGGVDDRFFAPVDATTVEAARATYGVSANGVLHVGGLKARRNLPTLVRAVASLPPETASQLTLAGAGPEAESLASMARLVGLGDRFHLAGFVADADLPAVYHAAGCVVLAGTEEGFGLPALEAMACGTPVIAARAGALPEIAGHAARFFPAEDVSALATHLREVLQSGSERERLVRLGREQAERFTWHRCGAAIETVLREVVASPGGRRRERLVRSAASRRG